MLCGGRPGGTHSNGPARKALRLGLVESLARPGGNVTGLSDFHGHLGAKRLELLQALVLHPTMVATTHRRRIFEFAVQRRLPAIYTVPQMGEAGGLMSYGAHFPDMWRRTVGMFDEDPIMQNILAEGRRLREEDRQQTRP